MKLKGKTALITGAGGGIGRSIARVYVKEGASAIICGRNEDSLKEAVREITSYGEIEYVKINIVKRNDLKILARRVEEKWNRLDILVNNASILGVRTKIQDYPVGIWKEVIDINLNGQFFIIKTLLPFLIRSKSASIINVSSSVGRKGKALWGAYSVSKFGLEGLTQILADELSSSNIRVNSVNPGGTRTAMRASAYPDEDPMTLPNPDEITPIFLYLASDESIGINGRSLEARDWIVRI
jgi:NAD(P)-dependent dehydrogenase (short-subunit alcohol dehydrogenase family)